MPAVVIADASCLILLHKIGALEILKAMYGGVLITDLIATEFGMPLPEWMIIQNPKDSVRQRILEANLDSGEASALALALEQSAAC